MKLTNITCSRMKEVMMEKGTSNFCLSFNSRKWSLGFLLTIIISSHVVCCITAATTSTFISSSLHSSLPSFNNNKKMKSRIKLVPHNCETSTRVTLRTHQASSVPSASSATPKTALLAKKKNDEMESNRDGAESTSTDKGSKKNGKRRNFMKRIFNKDKDSSSSSSSNERDNNSNNNNKGILGMVGKVLKRSSNEIQYEDEEKSTSIDPSFKSEIALRTELRRQVALDRYEAGDEIPKEFLPPALLLFEAQLNNDNGDKKLPPFELVKIISSLDESIFYMEKQFEILKMEQRKYSGEVIPSVVSTPSEKRLIKLKRDLETRRKNVILDDQKQKRSKALQKKAEQEKERMASVRAFASLQKKGSKKEQNESSNDDDDDDTADEKRGMGKNISNAMDSVGKNLSNAMDGMTSGAQSALTNVWKKTTRNTDEWITVCPKTRISPGEVFPVVAGGVDLLVIGSKDGTKIHCIANTCPHLGTPLETGMIERRICGKSKLPSNGMSTEDDTKPIINDGFEDCIVCPLHQTAFSLDTGEVSGDWCPYPPVIGKVMGNIKQKK